MEKRDHTRIYGLLRRLGHTGTEDEIAERIRAVAPRAGVRANALAEDFPCSAPPASAEWRQNRAEVGHRVRACVGPGDNAVSRRQCQGASHRDKTNARI